MDQVEVMDDPITSEQENATAHQGTMVDLVTITIHQLHQNTRIVQATVIGTIETAPKWAVVARIKRIEPKRVGVRLAVVAEKGAKTGQIIQMDAHVLRTKNTRITVNNPRHPGTIKARTMQRIMNTREKTSNNKRGRGMLAMTLDQTR